MLLLALQASRLQTGPVRGDWLPSNPESVRAVQRLEEMGRGNVVQILRVLLVLPETLDGRDGRGLDRHAPRWRRLSRTTRASRACTRPPRTRPSGSRTRGSRSWPDDGSISQDERSVLFEVLPPDGLEPMR